MAAKEKRENRLNQLNLTKKLNISMVRTQLMLPIAKGESALVHVLFQFAPVDVFGQAVGHVVLPLHFDDGQLSSSDLLLHPQLTHLHVSNSPSTSS